jgi:hypothetical protein
MPASVKLVTMLFRTTSHLPRCHYCVTVLLVVNGLIFPSGFTCQYFLNIGYIFFLSVCILHLPLCSVPRRENLNCSPVSLPAVARRPQRSAT